MNIPNLDTKTAILESALPSIPFDGWTLPVLEEAAMACGYSKSMVRAVFPDGVKDAIKYFSRWADDQMMEALSGTDPQTLRVRDKVYRAVQSRLEVLSKHKEAERLAVAFWMRPMRKFEGAMLVWKTADRIWDWAGDTATDYNRYTKRGLLSAVITSTTFYWLNDTSKSHQDTWAFLDRRIENVLSIGKITARFKTA